MSDDRMRYRVAVVVFADTLGTDYSEAASGAAMNVRAALQEGRSPGFPIELDSPLSGQERFKGCDLTARVVGVMELGMAAGNGYLWSEPTARAWTNYGNDLPEIARRTWKVEEQEGDDDDDDD